MKASPVARKLAAEKGVDLSVVAGSGPGGRITREDVLAAAAGAVAPAGASAAATAAAEGIEPLSSMRKAIARQMSLSKREVPHYYVVVEVDMTEAAARRKKLKEATPEGKPVVSVTHLILKATALALREFPEVRSQWAGSGLRPSEDVNLGIAVSLDDGLIVPVLHGADSLDLQEIAERSEALVARAREKKLSQEEFTGGTITISNMGMMGVDVFLPIINTPEAAIIGVGAMSERPAVVDGKICPRLIMKLAVSGDHRVIDGATAGRFLARMKSILEEADPLLPA